MKEEKYGSMSKKRAIGNAISYILLIRKRMLGQLDCRSDASALKCDHARGDVVKKEFNGCVVARDGHLRVGFASKYVEGYFVVAHAIYKVIYYFLASL